MDYTLVALRLAHIVAAFAWVGVGTMLTFVILPSIQQADGARARALGAVLIHPWVIRALPISSGLTMLAGILLYAVSRAGSHFSSTGNVVLGIGALAGILAGIHGGALTGRALRALGDRLTRASRQDEQAQTVDGGQDWQGLARRAMAHSRISLLLMMIALLGMASARYL